MRVIRRKKCSILDITLKIKLYNRQQDHQKQKYNEYLHSSDFKKYDIKVTQCNTDDKIPQNRRFSCRRINKKFFNVYVYDLIFRQFNQK